MYQGVYGCGICIYFGDLMVSIRYSAPKSYSCLDSISNVSLQVVLERLSECSDTVNSIERTLNPLDTVTTNVDKLSHTADQIEVIQYSLMTLVDIKQLSTLGFALTTGIIATLLELMKHGTSILQ